MDWSKSHNGVLLCTVDRTYNLMPEVKPIIEDLINSGSLELDSSQYLVDVKVHMLMPGQYPCIPGWHCDFVPRNNEGEKVFEDITGEKMYLWVSGEPRTEFKNSVEHVKNTKYDWVVFDQLSVHRGVESRIHTWRCFIRLIPKKFVHPFTKNVGEIRRHSQVYLTTENYSW